MKCLTLWCWSLQLSEDWWTLWVDFCGFLMWQRTLDDQQERTVVRGYRHLSLVPFITSLWYPSSPLWYPSSPLSVLYLWSSDDSSKLLVLLLLWYWMHWEHCFYTRGQLCACPYQVQLTEFTTGGLWLISRSISRMISGNDSHLSSISRVTAKELNQANLIFNVIHFKSGKCSICNKVHSLR